MLKVAPRSVLKDLWKEAARKGKTLPDFCCKFAGGSFEIQDPYICFLAQNGFLNTWTLIIHTSFFLRTSTVRSKLFTSDALPGSAASS